MLLIARIGYIIHHTQLLTIIRGHADISVKPLQSSMVEVNAVQALRSLFFLLHWEVKNIPGLSYLECSTVAIAVLIGLGTSHREHCLEYVSIKDTLYKTEG